MSSSHLTPVDRIASALSTPLARLVMMATVLAMLAPPVIVIALSVSADNYFHFPVTHVGLRQYQTLAASEYWRAAIIQSFMVATPTAFLSLLVGVPAVIALNRTRFPFKASVRAFTLVPLVLPGVTYAIAMYSFYLRVQLVGTFWGLVLSHTILAIPFVVLIVGSAISRVPTELELAAMSLGASRFRAMVGITVRLLLPAMGAALVFAFLASFDEATFVNFVGGPGLITLPKAIFDSLRFGVDPVITAIATLLMLSTGIAATLAVYWRRA